tara:strand:+ start:463 stop:591 length:129 start_codon:yes stop_codon:yes gene_type:complete
MDKIESLKKQIKKVEKKINPYKIGVNNFLLQELKKELKKLDQ